MNEQQKKVLVVGVIVLLAVTWWSSRGGDITPRPKPIEPSEVSVLIVNETADDVGDDVIYAAEIRQWVKGHCDKDANGAPEFRVLDKDADVSKMSQKFQEQFNLAKTKRLPYLAVSNGKQGADGDLPLTVEETLAVLKKWGGE
jgi:hypothetical protein